MASKSFAKQIFISNQYEKYAHNQQKWYFMRFSLTHWPPGKFEWNFRHVIFKHILVIDGWGISCEIALIWMSLDFIDDQSTLVQVMDWCRQATSHYLSQCWPRSLSPYGVIRPQSINYLISGKKVASNMCPNKVIQNSDILKKLLNIYQMSHNVSKTKIENIERHTV